MQIGLWPGIRSGIFAISEEGVKSENFASCCDIFAITSLKDVASARFFLSKTREQGAEEESLSLSCAGSKYIRYSAREGL